MRNLKKLFAVVMVVAMLASIMVPALAADVQYETEAEMLKDLGLFLGTNNGFELEAELTREQALALMIRVMGLEEEVKAMTQPEVAEQMAKVVDPETVTDWAKPYVAYAIKNGLTDGIDAKIKPNVKFAGQLTITGKEFINFMLKGMGYDMTGKWDDVLTFAAETGMISAGDAVKFGSITVMKRDFAVAIMASALNGMTAYGVTLAQYLVDQGAVSEDKMVEYGFITPTVAPTEAPEEITVEAYADNLIQVVVVFSTELDADTAEDEDNYKINDGDLKVESADLQDDGSTVVLTLKYDSALKVENQDKFDLTIKGVKTVDGAEIEETTLEDVEFLDETIPTVVDAQVIGKDAIKVIFSEPVKPASTNTVDNATTYYLNKSSFVVNNGKLFVKEVILQNNYTEAIVKLYSTLKEGEVTLQVKSTVEDFAGFGVIAKLITLEVVKDEEAPVVIGYEKAKPTEVTLIWSEDVQFDGKNLSEWYHTNGNNKADDVTIDGNKTTLTFSKNNKLPEGTAYVYVLKEAVKDYWDNKNDQQMIKIEVELDTTPPEVKEVKQGDTEDTVVVTYSEKMDKDSVQKRDNYTVLNEKGEEQKGLVKSAPADKDVKKVTLKFDKKLSGEYTLVIKNVKDEAGNKIEEVSVPFTIVDKTDPEPEDFDAYVYYKGTADQMIKITFGEKMAVDGKYSVADIEKYQYKDGDTYKAFKSFDDVEIEVVDDGKAVEIYVPAVIDGKAANKTFNKDDVLRIARVADVAGNYTDLYFELTIKEPNAVEIDTVHATARDTVKITFKDEVKFDISDFTVTDGVYDYEPAEVDVDLNDKGKTVATIKLGKKLAYTWNDGDIQLEVAANPKTENAYGVKVDTATKNIIDKIAPELYDDGIKDTGFDKTGNGVGDYLEILAKDTFRFKLYFSEAMKTADVDGDGTPDLAYAGADFEISIDGNKYANGKDYRVVDITNNVITFEIIKKSEVKEGDKIKGYEVKGDLEIKLVQEPVYVTDSKGNAPKAFDTIEFEDLEFYKDK